jgi:eukaryotic-like serine/threonine-protein kinase
MSPRSNLPATIQKLIGDKYELQGWIGAGGMAEVFLARHRIHGALFAVKVLAEHLAGDPKVVARFLAEARTAATLGGHPNIAPVFDIGNGDGVYYLIMPYIEGEDVSGYLERHGRLTEAEAVSIVRQVALALVWAAERNVVHRDLKPSNIRIDATGRVIVLDFGIAKAGDIQSALTVKGETPGTIYYMSPEQIRGDGCDARSDLYSLGVVFFELLTGLKPFDGDSAKTIEAGHLHRLPPALGTMLAVDPELEQIVKQLLEKDPCERCPSAAELLDRLAALSERLSPVQLRPQIHSPKTEPVPMDSAPFKERKPTEMRVRLIVPSVAGGAAVVAIAIWLALTANAASHTKKSPGKRQTQAASTIARRSLPLSISDAHGLMFLVPAGLFVFGDDSKGSPNTKQQVELPGFYVDAMEVSNAQFAAFAKATARNASEWNGWRTSPDVPVAAVTFSDAQAYCGWANRRLPTEQEWEKAARGTKGAVYPWGNEPLDSPGKLVPVDEYPERQSPFRALNMAGNVFEWTTTRFPVTQTELDDMRAQTGQGNIKREWYCVKGGSFLVENQEFFRSYMRRGWPVDQGSPAIGFRCVKDAN